MPDLKTILASHTRIHAAEGEFCRAEVAGAWDRARIKVIRLKECDVAGVAATKLKLTESEIKWRIDAFGKSLGPPRAADQKLSVMAAWLGLAA